MSVHFSALEQTTFCACNTIRYLHVSLLRFLRARFTCVEITDIYVSLLLTILIHILRELLLT